MRKNFRLILLGIILFCFSSCRINYVKFRSINYDYDLEKYYYEDSFSKEFEDNFVRVLDFFKEDYKYINNELYINRKLSRDKEWLWNLCRKAKDSVWLERTSPEWIRSHVIKKQGNE